MKDLMKSTDILGIGWSFPVAVDSCGRIALTRGEVDIEQAVQTIVLTPKGQRVMRPRFGCRIHELIFDPNNLSTISLAQRYVREALEMWEPRIRVLSVDVSHEPDNPEQLSIHVQYQVKATYDNRALVVPFYRIPPET